MARNQNKKSENSIKLTWNYYCRGENEKYKKRTISERVYSDEEVNDSVIAYLADLEYVRRVKLDYYQDREPQWGDMIEEITEFISSDFIPSGMARRSDYIMLQFVAMAAYRIKEYAIIRLSDANNNLNTIHEIQGEVNESCKKVSAFFRLVTTESQKSFDNKREIWEKLLKEAKEILPKIEGISESLQREILDYILKTRNRCIGLYIFDNFSVKPLVAFSGYLDCTEDVKELVGCGYSANSRTLKAFNNVCASIDAKLVRTSPCVRRYLHESGNRMAAVCLKEAFRKNGNKAVHDNYHCCERKIFTEFGAQDGYLFTTRYACTECQNAFDYYVKQMDMDVVQQSYEFVTIFRKKQDDSCPNV